MITSSHGPVIDRSLSLALSRQVYGVPHPKEIYTYRTLREYFAATLDKVAGRLTHHKKLVMVFDGLDHLAAETGAQSLSWLPDSWPRHVHVVLTTDTAHELSMHTLDNHINHILCSQEDPDRTAVHKDSFFWHIGSFTVSELDGIVESELMQHSRTLTYRQHAVCTFYAFDIQNFGSRPLLSITGERLQRCSEAVDTKYKM